MRYLTNNCTDPYFNMAFDEYCLKHLSIDEPVFYLWQNRPSVIIGMNQEVNTEVDLEYLKANDIMLVRRVSGGGAVYHDLGNLNYTIVGRSEDLENDYPEYTRYMLYALQSLGVPVTLSGRNDILVEGKKISGFAKRVNKDRLMIHGTLMYQVDMEKLTKALCPSSVKLQSKGIASVRSRVTNLSSHLSDITDIQALKERLERILSNNYTDKEYILKEKDLQNIRQLADDKFAKWEWIYGRSPQATLNHSVHLPCGIVQIKLVVKENRITSCHIVGDFIGNLPATDIEDALKDLPYDADAIKEGLRKMDVSQYFDRITLEELVSLIMVRNS